LIIGALMTAATKALCNLSTGSASLFARQTLILDAKPLIFNLIFLIDQAAGGFDDLAAGQFDDAPALWTYSQTFDGLDMFQL
jgi:hypothetical protein